MKYALPMVGALLALVGIVWLLQGLNFLPGSFMTGQSFWAWMGLLSFVVGAVLLFVGLSRLNQHA